MKARPIEGRWPQTARVWRQFAQLNAVAARLDIDMALAARKAEGRVLASARDKCFGCASDQRCSDWLQGKHKLSALAEFCPNFAFFMACRQNHYDRAARLGIDYTATECLADEEPR